LLQLESERHGAVVVVDGGGGTVVAGAGGGAVVAGVLVGGVVDGAVVVGTLDGVVVAGFDLDGRAVAARETCELAHAPAVSASTASAATTFHDRGRLMGSLFLVESGIASRGPLMIPPLLGPASRSRA
jgi:hypothetical protein